MMTHKNKNKYVSIEFSLLNLIYNFKFYMKQNIFKNKPTLLRDNLLFVSIELNLTFFLDDDIFLEFVLLLLILLLLLKYKSLLILSL